MITVFLATWYTRKFEFSAVAEHESEAIWTIAYAWALHCKQYPDADPKLFDREEVQITRMELAKPYRDGELMPPEEVIGLSRETRLALAQVRDQTAQIRRHDERRGR